ncbi:MAG: hypothetical protein KatS3mg003_0779 [Candidatus Nitrosocaldaceae archaeon]|nr:MAG: hypothetical protein KatS3mg003_0779 [Candidatus Nitrosocaldaceae archaeon]
MKIIYLEEEHVLQLRNSINLDNNYLSKSSLLYILDGIKVLLS